ncbi:MAG: ABC transporter substrate-binding protein [Candidatus Cloacimonetes bacterium]|nr:ABC transporter substrate-binding protein [Candidatus Cloacimonadota bacterium]
MYKLFDLSFPAKASIRLGALLSAMALLILAVGCGKKQAAPSTQSKPALQAETADTADLFKLRYRLKWLHQAQFAGAYMAREKGFYRQRGLEVELLSGGGDYPPYQSLMEGSAEIANLNLITALNNYDPARPIVNLAQISQKNSTLLVGKKSSGIRTIEDLRGKKVGIWRDEGGIHTIYFLEMLDLDIQVIPFDWSVNLLLNDAIDMMSVMDYNEYHRILMSGLDEDELVVFDLADYDYNLVDDGIYTKRSFYEAHRQQCDDFTEATIQGWLYALEHPEETLNVVLRYQRENYLPANPEHQAWMLDHMKRRVLQDSHPPGFLALEDFNLAHRILEERGLIPKAIDYNTFFPHGNPEKN